MTLKKTRPTWIKTILNQLNDGVKFKAGFITKKKSIKRISPSNCTAIYTIGNLRVIWQIWDNLAYRIEPNNLGLWNTFSKFKSVDYTCIGWCWWILEADSLFWGCILWQYELWSFQTGGTKLERFLPNSQHTLRKLLNFENWVSGEVSKKCKITQPLDFQSQFSISKIIWIFLNWRISI